MSASISVFRRCGSVIHACGAGARVALEPHDVQLAAPRLGRRCVVLLALLRDRFSCLLLTALARDFEASKSRRKQLLEWFQRRFQIAPFSGELESECGTDASLFFARVLVWMQKTTAAPLSGSSKKRFFALSEQLACVQIFLASATVHVYYREFQQANGLALLINVLQAGDSSATRGGSVSDEDRRVVLGILFRISQRGRAHKEEISSCDGELAIIRGALAGSERCMNMASPLWEACRDTLLEQMVGNPNSVEQAHRAIGFMLSHSENELRMFGAQVVCWMLSTLCELELGC